MNESKPSTASMEPSMAPQRVLIIPGNGCTPVRRSNWYLSVQRALNRLGFEAVLEDMPDPLKACESIWLPFIRNTLKSDENTIIIGHSSGAEALMRLLETDKLKGAVLISACHTDLGLQSEHISGYYSRPWQWEKIRSNAQWILQLGSKDDPFIPVEEMRHVAQNLHSEYIEYDDRGHFLTSDLPELVQLVVDKVKRGTQTKL